MWLHLWRYLSVWRLHALWPTLAPVTEEGGSTALLARRVRVVAETAMENLASEGTVTMFTDSSHTQSRRLYCRRKRAKSKLFPA
jgi:hypothetical protein